MNIHLENGIQEQSMRDHHNQIYNPVFDVIEGKKERFRETLFGTKEIII